MKTVAKLVEQTRKTAYLTLVPYSKPNLAGLWDYSNFYSTTLDISPFFWGEAMKKTRLMCWSVPVTATLDNLLEKAVRAETYATKADLIRDSVRRNLRELGYLSDSKLVRWGDKDDR